MQTFVFWNIRPRLILISSLLSNRNCTLISKYCKLFITCKWLCCTGSPRGLKLVYKRNQARKRASLITLGFRLEFFIYKQKKLPLPKRKSMIRKWRGSQDRKENQRIRLGTIRTPEGPHSKGSLLVLTRHSH